MRLRNRGGMVQPETLGHNLRDFGQARLSSVVMESPVFPPIVSHVYQSPRWRPPRPLRPHSASAKVVVVEAGERRHGWAWTWVGLVRRVLRSRRLPEARLAAAGAAGAAGMEPPSAQPLQSVLRQRWPQGQLS